MIPMHALLIGIDHYDPNDYCTSLAGAVADVEAMAEVLRRGGVAEDRIRFLVSRAPDLPGFDGPPGVPPTYEAMVDELQRLHERAQPGEQVLVHYSGHGGRTRTLLPGSKGEEGIDEGFVPPDVGRSSARYLRDVELAYLVDQMVQKGLLVTLVIDACHSGGMLRGRSGLVRRGRRQIDPTDRPLESLVAELDVLEAAWRRLAERTYSSARGTQESRWLPGARGFVLLSACRAVESAYEVPLDGQVRGLLSHTLTQLLATQSSPLTWQQVYDQLVGRIRKLAPSQTPVLEGEGSRQVFGGKLQPPAPGIKLLEVAEDGSRVLLDGGQATGLGKGALVRILPEGPSLEITECGAASSWATLFQDEPSQPRVRPGDRAVLVDPGQSFRRQVAWLTAPARSGAASPLERQGESKAHKFLEPAEKGELADFQVALTDDGEYELWHSDGAVVIDAPRVAASYPGAEAKVVELLTHLARFYNVRDLENRDACSPLRNAIHLDLDLLPEHFELGQDPTVGATRSAGAIPEAEIDRWICLSITNRSLQALQVYILSLQPGWGIELVFPRFSVETLEGGKTLHLPLEVYVPSEIHGRREILKVFATAETTDFRWLCQPSIGQPPAVPRSTLGSPAGPLERLFAEIAKDGPKARHVRSEYASRHWTSAQVEFQIVDPS